MDKPDATAWGTAAAALGAAAFTVPLLPFPSAFLLVGLFAFALLLPLAIGGYRVARKAVGIEPTPLLAALARRGPLPPRAVLIPGVAVGVALLALAWNLLATPLFAGILGDGLPKASPIFLSGPQFLLVNSITVMEEIAFRLGALFLLAGLFRARVAPGERKLTAPAWAAIVASGLLFGLFHVMNAGYYGYALGPFVVFSLLSQGVSGTFFGWVGWRWGVEAAWLAHFGFNLFAFHLGRIAL